MSGPSAKSVEKHWSALAETDVAFLWEIFNTVGGGKTGAIRGPEIANLLRLIGLHNSQSNIDAALAELDADGNGQISFEEFLQVLVGVPPPKLIDGGLLRAFRLLASDSPAPPHHISRDALHDGLAKYGNTMTNAAEIRYLIQVLSPHDGPYLDITTILANHASAS